MKAEHLRELCGTFDGITRTEQGTEFWLARELQPHLGYDRWENFAKVIERAKSACQNSDQAVADHFREVTKMVSLGAGTQREIDDVALTRYACYLIAQNGDPKKPPVAFAQTYFALQTRKQELVEQRLAEVERLAAREKLTGSEKSLSGIIYERVKDEKSFARIRSKGDAALFGGMTTGDMKKRLAVPDSRPLADFLPTIIIKAKDFANEITNFNIKEKDLSTEQSISSEHVQNNRDVRNVLAGRGIRPESLPAAEDIKKLDRRIKSDQRTLPGGADKLPPGTAQSDGIDGED
ncbi:DNA damage-inducible protein D [soil metagenome]